MTACTCRERYSASELLYNYILHLIGYFRHVTSLLMRAARRPAAIVNAVITHTAGFDYKIPRDVVFVEKPTWLRIAETRKVKCKSSNARRETEC